MTDRNACRGNLILVLAVLVALAGFQPGFSDDETVQYLRYRAGQGDVEAQDLLGGMYYFGEGVLQNYREATKWTRMAADQGHATAQERLGRMYREGQGVPENYYEAGKWLRRAVEGYRKAAEQGHAEAQYNLGRMYREGEGVPQNDLEAAHLFGDHPRSRFIVPSQSTGDEGKKTSPEAPGGLNFGTIEFVSKPGPEPSPPFKVGIVQANGNLVPLATFDGEDWSRIDLSEDWRSGRRVQSTGEWTLWYENPGPSPQFPYRALLWIDRLSPVRIEIATTGLIASDPRCTPRIFAMATDVGDRSKSLIECDHCCPEPKRGFATTSKLPPDLVARLDPEDEEDLRIATQILDIFNEHENKAFERTHYEYDDKTLAEHVEPRLSAEKRNRLPFRFDDSFRVEGITTTYYYVEVSRDYYEHLREEFPYAALLQGWVRATADGLVWMTQSFRLTEMEQKDIDYDTPILSWRRGSVVDVLFKRSQWGSGYYGILRIDNDTVNELIGVGFR